MRHDARMWDGSDTGERLTERQREVLRLIERGHTNSEIAERLGISLQGVKWHVRELLGKYAVENREELVEAVAAERRPLAGLRRRLRALLPVAGWKMAGAAVGSAVVLGSAGFAAAAIASGGAVAEKPADEIAAAETPTPTPTPGFVAVLSTPSAVATLPTVTGAKWTVDEARDAALAAAEAKFDTYLQPEKVGVPLDLHDFALTRVEWHPGVSRYDAADGDRYFETKDGAVKDLWLFEWELDGVPLVKPSPSVATNVVVDVLIADGSSTAEAVAVEARDPNRGTALAGGSDFRSRSQDARLKLESDPVGAMQRVAWLNGVAGTEELDVYPTASGWWCYAEQPGARICAVAPDRPELPVVYGAESRRDSLSGVSETPHRRAGRKFGGADSRHDDGWQGHVVRPAGPAAGGAGGEPVRVRVGGEFAVPGADGDRV